MRTKSTKQQYFDFTPKSRLKVVAEYRAKYELISQLLDDSLVQRFWAGQRRGSSPDEQGQCDGCD